MARFDLTDFEWSVIQPLLPNKSRGVPRVDDRRVLNGIFWRLRTGAPWADIPERYGLYPLRLRVCVEAAIAPAFRWREMLENGEYATIREIANAAKITEAYVGRVLRLTLLAPDIVEAILSGRQEADLQLKNLLWRFPIGWREQRATFFGWGLASAA